MDYEELQRDQAGPSKEATRWQMKLNVGKGKLMPLGKNDSDSTYARTGNT